MLNLKDWQNHRFWSSMQYDIRNMNKGLNRHAIINSKSTRIRASPLQQINMNQNHKGFEQALNTHIIMNSHEM